MEQVLAERVALCSWRLNRVVLYESEKASELQEGAVESVRRARRRKIETEQLFARPGQEVLTGIGVLIEAHPLNALDDAKIARAKFRAIERLFDAPADAPVKGDDAAAVLEAAAREAVELAAYQAGEELDSADAGPLADALIERLPGLPDYAYLDETDYTVGRLRELVGWLAVARAGPSPTRTRLTAPW
jgi:hypothetical protein